jgi:hypothetical protein
MSTFIGHLKPLWMFVPAGRDIVTRPLENPKNSWVPLWGKATWDKLAANKNLVEQDGCYVSVESRKLT